MWYIDGLEELTPCLAERDHDKGLVTAQSEILHRFMLCYLLPSIVSKSPNDLPLMFRLDIDQCANVDILSSFLNLDLVLAR